MKKILIKTESTKLMEIYIENHFQIYANAYMKRKELIGCHRCHLFNELLFTKVMKTSTFQSKYLGFFFLIN